MLRLRVTRYHPTPRQWPADFPLKIAVIADIHACDPWMSLERIEAIVDRTNALNADIIVLLGDYVAGLRQVTRIIPASEWATVLAGLKAPLGVHAVMGNHDYWDGQDVQQAGHGPTVAHRALESGRHSRLRERRRAAHQGWPRRSGSPASAISSPICRRGASGRSRRFGADDLNATLAKVTDDAPIILLAHEPNIAPRVPARVALQLSGHTHGGQVRLLGWSPAVPPQPACGSPMAMSG